MRMPQSNDLHRGVASSRGERLKEAVLLIARSSAMVCYLFVGSWTLSSIFS
jgi:TRAP-type mannitol/chloroaromatic compound transport system permease large subunit